MATATAQLDPVQQRALGASTNYAFTLYVRLVLPLDGFVFWVKADLLSKSALYNALGIGGVTYNQAQVIQTPANVLQIEGAFHYATTLEQKEESDISINAVTFTTEHLIQDFNLLGPNAIYICTYGPDDTQFAFAGHGPFFPEAGIFHYYGHALYSTMASQLIDKLDGFSQAQVVSNSLPIWLSLNSYVMLYPWLAGPQFRLYPSFLTPLNLTPPYAAVHIVPESTQPIAAAPHLSPSLSHSQLTKETVRITFFGVRNDDALSFVDFVNQYTLDNDAVMGIMNMPAIKDEKVAQVELSIIAQKKSIEYEISYYQRSARKIARELILSAIPTFIFNEA